MGKYKTGLGGATRKAIGRLAKDIESMCTGGDKAKLRTILMDGVREIVQGECDIRGLPGGPLRFRFEEFTPTKCESILAQTKSPQRALSGKTVAEYARDMKNKVWRITGDTLKFDSDGNNKDGQHRLHACIKAKTPFHSYVAYDMPEEAMEAVDSGYKRSFAHHLRISEGMSGSQQYAVMVKNLLTYRQARVTHTPTYSKHELASSMKSEKDLQDSFDFVHGLYSRGASIVTTGIGACVYQIIRSDPRSPSLSRAQEFIRGLMTGADLPQDSPVYILRQRLLTYRGGAGKILTRPHRFALIFKTWIAFRDGTRIKQLKWGRKEVFPYLSGTYDPVD